MKILLIVIYILFPSVISADFLFWFGYFQTGKSSCIKLLTGDETMRVGLTKGWKSFTKQMKVYDEKTPLLGNRYHHIDTVGIKGIGDYFVLKGPDQIREQVHSLMRLTSKTGRIKAIMIPMSYKRNVYILVYSFSYLNQIFGEVPATSIVIVMTDCKTNIKNGNKKKIRKIALQFGVPQSQIVNFEVSWQNLSLSNIKTSQLDKMKEAIHRSKRTKTYENIIRKFYEPEIKQMAKDIKKGLKPAKIHIINQRGSI